MNRRNFLRLTTAALVVRAARRSARAQTVSGIMAPVLRRGVDNCNSGSNLQESTLTQANVTAHGIRKFFSLPMEGDARGCEAQPLIVPSVAVDDGTTRDVCVVCSMNGLVYAFDANDSDILWVKKVSVPVNGSNAIDAWGINDHWSILSTPVIDQAAGRIYLVAWTDPNGVAQTARYFIHVLNLKDGSRVCPPVLVAGTSNGQTFSSIMRKQRSSLLMTNVNGVKTVFFACGTVQETSDGAAGWIIAFDVASLSCSAALALSSGEGAGVWMGGAGLCADSAGYLYAVTGNGGFDGVADFGESVIKVKYTGTALEVVDWWSPWNDRGREGQFNSNAQMVSPKLAGTNAATSTKNLPVNMGHMTPYVTSPDAGWNDEDLGSAGLLLIEPMNMVLASGKDGIAYLVNSQTMGKTMPGDFQNPAANYAKLIQPPQWFTYFPGYGVSPAPQDVTKLDFLPGGKTRHMHSTPVFYESSVHGPMVFCWGENSPLRAWKLSGTGLSYLAQGNEIASANVTASPGGMPGGFMCLSANGSLAGTALLWALIPYGDANRTVTNGRLLCYDAENFANGVIKVLWDSQAWGIVFLYSKFNPPVVSGGKIFVPTYADAVDVYGLAA